MKNLKVLLVGSSGFPFGMAESQKQRMIAKSLKKNGINTWIINRSGIITEDNYSHPKRISINTGIPYLCCSPNISKSKHRLNRNCQKFIGYFYELAFISRLKPTILIASTKSFFDIIYFKCLSKCFNFKFLITYAELNSSMTTRDTLYFKINDFLYEKLAFHFLDGILPISEYLISFVKEKRSYLPLLKTPSLVDLDLFSDKRSKILNPNFFLFCGDPKYFEIIAFIISSFNLIKNMDFHLYLLLGDAKKDVMKIEELVEKSNKKELIKIYGYMPYEQIVDFYLNAKALLVPLKPNKRDVARFPNKIAEYLASGNPIISTNIGEIKHYFKDGINGLIAENYDIYEFSSKMNLIIEQPLFAEKIGLEGKALCRKQFDYLIYGKRIIAFFDDLYKKK